ncbi:MAG TPA: hypothetical protein VFW07_10760 [Parafilimonas sp.]|nr:hypothetical protein [Parafilimonas sp.]
MSNKLLLPNRYKKIGWFLLIPATILGIILMTTQYEGLSLEATTFAIYNDEVLGKTQFFSFIHTNITNTVTGILFITGGLLVGFSKEKTEDEFIANLRQSSLLWSVFVNYVLLLAAFAFIYGTAFFNVMVYNMFTVLIIFIARFNYMLYRNSKLVPNEKYN